MATRGNLSPNLVTCRMIRTFLTRYMRDHTAANSEGSCDFGPSRQAWQQIVNRKFPRISIFNLEFGIPKVDTGQDRSLDRSPEVFAGTSSRRKARSGSEVTSFSGSQRIVDS